jgi:hypothetical protein
LPLTLLSPQVIYVIEIEFFTGPLKAETPSNTVSMLSMKRPDLEQKEPLLWSVGVTIVPPASSTGGRKCFIPHGSSSQFIDPKSILVESAV